MYKRLFKNSYFKFYSQDVIYMCDKFNHKLVGIQLISYSSYLCRNYRRFKLTSNLSAMDYKNMRNEEESLFQYVALLSPLEMYLKIETFFMERK